LLACGLGDILREDGIHQRGHYLSWPLPARASALRIKCTRQRCRAALNTFASFFEPEMRVRNDELAAAQCATREAA
jgi:hypothetical protein